MRKRSGIIFVAIGVMLMISALLLYAYNSYDSFRAGEESDQLLGEVKAAIEFPDIAEVEFDVEMPLSENEEQVAAEMAVVIIDGYGYIGYVSIPVLKLELPIMAEWDYARLKTAPCRHAGTVDGNDLVIAAHNYSTHFGTLSGLELGTEVLFTDMTGTVTSYSLERLETMAPDAVDEVLNSEYDLVLYTCTPGGATRVVAFCRRLDK